MFLLTVPVVAAGLVEGLAEPLGAVDGAVLAAGLLGAGAVDVCVVVPGPAASLAGSAPGRRNTAYATPITAATTTTTASSGRAATSGLVRARWAPRRLASSGTTRRSSYPPWRVLLLMTCSFGAAWCSVPCSANRPSRSAYGAPRQEVRSA